MLVVWALHLRATRGFSSTHRMFRGPICPATSPLREPCRRPTRPQQRWMWWNVAELSSRKGDPETEVILVNGETSELSEAEKAEIDASQPSEWSVMKEVRMYYTISLLLCAIPKLFPSCLNVRCSFYATQILGINIFTYAIAAAITFFFSMNVILGPGWLGNRVGLKGTGSFTEISDSLPGLIDLSGNDFLL
jgi:hypothetical protein